jgi:hypothetical protein
MFHDACFYHGGQMAPAFSPSAKEGALSQASIVCIFCRVRQLLEAFLIVDFKNHNLKQLDWHPNENG